MGRGRPDLVLPSATRHCGPRRFSPFARLTLKHARRTYGRTSREIDAVRAGWDAAKVPL